MNFLKTDLDRKLLWIFSRVPSLPPPPHFFENGYKNGIDHSVKKIWRLYREIPLLRLQANTGI